MSALTPLLAVQPARYRWEGALIVEAFRFDGPIRGGVYDALLF